MKERDWDVFVRWCGLAASIVILGISVFFSSWGFSFDMKNYDWAIWISLCLGAVVTIIELNGYKTEKVDRAYLLIWLLAYLYGAYTNVMGLIQIRGGAVDWKDYILPVIVGAFIEIVPEKLFIKSLRELNILQKSSQKLNSIPTVPGNHGSGYTPTHRPQGSVGSRPNSQPSQNHSKPVTINSFFDPKK